MPDGVATFNTRGIPSRICLGCGSDLFKVLVRFDEDGDISFWTTNGYCAECHAPVTVPVPDYVVAEEVEFDDEYDVD